MYLNWKKEKPHDEHYIDKIQACRISKDKNFLIDIMNTETDLYILRGVAVNESADEFMLLSLFDLKSNMINTAIASNKNASENLLYEIACESLDIKTFFALLNNDNCSARIIKKILLAKPYPFDVSLYYDLAQNINTPADVLDSLSNTIRDDKAFMRSMKMYIIQNKNTSFETLLRIADNATKEEDGYILEVLERRGVFTKKKELDNSSEDLLVS